MLYWREPVGGISPPILVLPGKALSKASVRQARAAPEQVAHVRADLVLQPIRGMRQCRCG